MVKIEQGKQLYDVWDQVVSINIESSFALYENGMCRQPQQLSIS